MPGLLLKLIRSGLGLLGLSLQRARLAPLLLSMSPRLLCLHMQRLPSGVP